MNFSQTLTCFAVAEWARGEHIKISASSVLRIRNTICQHLSTNGVPNFPSSFLSLYSTLHLQPPKTNDTVIILSTTAFLTLLPFLTSATPLLHARTSNPSATAPGAITLQAEGKASGTPIEDKAISALNGNFFINKPTVAESCPQVANCTLPTNVTAIFVLQGGTARIASEGSTQQVYVNGTDGALSYSPVHGMTTHFPYTTSNGTAVNGSDLGARFTYTPQTGSGPGRLTFDRSADGDEYKGYNAFWACPNGDRHGKNDVYKGFIAAERDSYLGIEVFGMQYTNGLYTAWTY